MSDWAGTNWFCLAAGLLQCGAFVYGLLSGGSWRVAAINGLVGVANILLSRAQ